MCGAVRTVGGFGAILLARFRHGVRMHAAWFGALSSMLRTGRCLKLVHEGLSYLLKGNKP
jgi:hypothetical protein